MVDAFKDIESSRSWVVSDERKAYFNHAKLQGVDLKGVNDFGGAVNDASHIAEANIHEPNTISLQDSLYQSPKPRFTYAYFIDSFICYLHSIYLFSFL
jgi:hypothetical protein